MRWHWFVLFIFLHSLLCFGLGWVLRENLTPKELLSPSDHIKEDELTAYRDMVVLKGNYVLAYYRNTNSMDPVLDETAMGIEKTDFNINEIHEGDIISFKVKGMNDTIVHRVTKIGYDAKGWYAITKGDNILSNDPIITRKEQVQGIIIGIIY